MSRNPITRAGASLLELLVDPRDPVEDVHEAIIAIEDEVIGLYACGQMILGGNCARPIGHHGSHEARP